MKGTSYMKKFLLSLLFLLPLTAQASDKSLELVLGGVTFHVMGDDDVSSLYSNKLSNNGRLIATPTLGVRYTRSPDVTYESAAIFIGTNSVGERIYGATASYGLKLENLELGLIGGGYIQNNNDFYAKGIIPYSLTDGTNALVPIFGIELNYRIRLGESTFLGINNILSPVITNHNLSLGFDL